MLALSPRALVALLALAILALLAMPLVASEDSVGALKEKSQETISPSSATTISPVDDFPSLSSDSGVPRVLTASELSELENLLKTASFHRFGLSELYNSSDWRHYKAGIQYQMHNFQTLSSSIFLAISAYEESVGRFHSHHALNALGEIYFYGEGGIPVNYTLSAQYFLLAVDSGDFPSASHHLSILYSTGLHGTISYGKSLIYDYFAAESHYPLAQLSMGWRYLYGIHLSPSCESSIEYYSSVATKVIENLIENPIPHIIERYRISEENSRDRPGEEDKDLIDYYQHRAAQGDSNAALALGQMFFFGTRGFPQDFSLAFEYFLSAVEKGGDSTAYYYLGTLYYYGLGMENGPNYEKSYEMYEKSIQTGTIRANNGLGIISLYGRGKYPINYPLALKYFKITAESGDSTGQYYLGLMYYTGKMGLEAHLPTALSYFGLAAVSGHTKAIYFLAKMHWKGQATPSSCTQAVKLYKNVAERGLWAMELNLAQQLFQSRKKIDSAMSFYMRIGMEGVEIAQANAGWLISNGYLTENLPKHEETAIGTGEDSSSSSSSSSSSLSLSFPSSSPPPLINSLVHSYYSYSALQNSIDSLRLLGDYSYYLSQNYPLSLHYYQLSADSRNSQAMWNIGWLYQWGAGGEASGKIGENKKNSPVPSSASSPSSSSSSSHGFITQDFHLSKRYYDLCLENDPLISYIPVKISLFLMEIQLMKKEYPDSRILSGIIGIIQWIMGKWEDMIRKNHGIHGLQRISRVFEGISQWVLATTIFPEIKEKNIDDISVSPSSSNDNDDEEDEEFPFDSFDLFSFDLDDFLLLLFSAGLAALIRRGLQIRQHGGGARRREGE